MIRIRAVVTMASGQVLRGQWAPLPDDWFRMTPADLQEAQANSVLDWVNADVVRLWVETGEAKDSMVIANPKHIETVYYETKQVP